FFRKNRRTPHVRVRAPARPRFEKVLFDAVRIRDALDSQASRLGRLRVPLSMAEATDALERSLGDPQCRIFFGHAALLFQAAQATGAVRLRGGLVAPAAWFPDEKAAEQAFFLRRFSDACIQSGFAVRKTPAGFCLSCGKRRLSVTVDAAKRRVRILPSKNLLTLEAFRARLSV
ncbi:MAG: hypothetical protein Q8P02_01730, partial [Candidatus Micrarchaeota archaeon]|nr:hypothetical protein [Candidatus Micrarchaeota archaeon]